MENFQNYFLMIAFVFVFYTLVKRNGFSKKEGLAAIAADVVVFAVLIFNGMHSPYLLMQFIPTFFIAYCFIHFFIFCYNKSVSSVNGMRDLMGKKKKFKESLKVAETNKNVKTYKGVKKKS